MLDNIYVINMGDESVMYELLLYTTSTGREPVTDFIKELAKHNKTREIAQIQIYADRLKEYGFTVNNYFPHTIRKLSDNIYELRPGSNRICFFFFDGHAFVLLHAFEKHSQKTPPNEIKHAEQERRDYIGRNSNEKNNT